MRTVTYLIPGGGVNPLTNAYSFRVWRIELCVGLSLLPNLASMFFVKFNNDTHPGALSTTLRAWRVMVGYRWYLPGK